MKISAYADDSSPNLSDKVIGTDVDNMNATKNFTIGQILDLANLDSFVPYTGATSNVNLGAFGIVANSIVKLGGTSSQFLKADGSVDSNTYLTASNIQFIQVLNGFSTLSQAPSALDTPIIVSFGPGQSNAYVILEDGGKVQFLQSGAYFINAYGSVERQGSSGGVAILLFRARLNGTQISTTKAFHLDNVDLSTPYEVSIPFQAEAGDVLDFQIMRDSSGVNAGGVYPHTNLGGWSNVPSTQIQIWKLN